MSYLLNSANYALDDPGSIPNLLVQHLIIVGISMVISIIIAIPVGLFIARYRNFSTPIITTADIAYTIPALALLGFLVLATGLSIITIIIPLVLYAQLVGIDPLLLEVGQAMGMNRWQRLVRVTLPLALPVILAGIRVAMVTSIGIASLSTLVGTDSLGNLIFLGIENTQNDQVIAGAILISLLAIVADLLLLALQVALNRGRSAVSAA